MWKAVETSTGEVRMGETKERGSQGRSREKERGEGKEEETEERKDSGSKESSRGVGDMG